MRRRLRVAPAYDRSYPRTSTAYELLGADILGRAGYLGGLARPDLLGLIAALAWRELFVERRSELSRYVRVYCLGHAILEALRLAASAAATPMPVAAQ